MGLNAKYDIYFTFPNELTGAENAFTGIITKTVENIKIALSRIIKRDVQLAVKGTDFNPSNYTKYLQNASAAVIFVYALAEKDDAYIAELQNVCDTFKISDVNSSTGCNRIFKICLEPPKGQLEPVCVNQLLPYNFYEKNLYNRKIKSLDYSSNDKSGVIYSKLLDLVYDISITLNRDAINESAYEQPKKSIYLGLTTFDQMESRDDLRRELLHYGYKVLPQASMPVLGEDFERALIACLQQSDTAIELMGSQYGDILKGTKYSLTDYQNRVIREYQQKDADTHFKRFIWIPQKNKISDQRQALYLKRLRRDDASENTEIIESPIETFKTIIASKLQDSNHNPRVQYENISKVYLITEEEQSSEYEEVYATLSLSGLRVVVTDYGEQVGIYARHLQALRDSDAVVVLQTSSNLTWLNSKIRDIIKSPGIGKITPFKRVVIATRLNPDKHLINMIKARVEILGENEATPETILNKLISG